MGRKDKQEVLRGPAAEVTVTGTSSAVAPTPDLVVTISPAPTPTAGERAPAHATVAPRAIATDGPSAI